MKEVSRKKYSPKPNFFKLIISLILILSFATSKNSYADKIQNSPDAYSLYNEAVVAYRTRHFNLAKQTFYKLIEEYPDDGITNIARINLANLLKDLKEYEKAIEIYKEIISKSSHIQDKQKAFWLPFSKCLSSKSQASSLFPVCK